MDVFAAHTVGGEQIALLLHQNTKSGNVGYRLATSIVRAVYVLQADSLQM